MYPARVRTSGIVIVRVTVNESGKVIKAEAISGPVELREASEQAARHWRFSPTLIGGRPAQVNHTIGFSFKYRG
jgi:protein TonB